MARGVAGYRIGLTKGGEVFPPNVCNAKSVRLALEAEIREAWERPEGLEVKEATETRFVLGDGRRFVRVAASETRMSFLYRKLRPVLEGLPESVWRGAMGRDEALTKIRSFSS